MMEHQLVGSLWAGGGLVVILALLVIAVETVMGDPGELGTPEWSSRLVISLISLICLIVLAWLGFATYLGLLWWLS